MALLGLLDRGTEPRLRPEARLRHLLWAWPAVALWPGVRHALPPGERREGDRRRREPGAGPDRKRYNITETGRDEVESWLSEPIPAEPHLQTDLFVKVVLSLMLGRPAEGYLDAQRAADLQRMRELTDLKKQGTLIDLLCADHGLFHLEADLRWIDLTTARLTALATEVAP